MSVKQRLLTVLFLLLSFLSLLTWMTLHPIRSAGVWANRVIVVAILIFCAAPIYPLYTTLRNRARLSAIAFLLLIAALVLGLVYLGGSLVLHARAEWLVRIANLSKVLIIASCVLILWNGFVRKAGN
jgi:hypothetical protein